MVATFHADGTVANQKQVLPVPGSARSCCGKYPLPQVPVCGVGTTVRVQDLLSTLPVRRQALCRKARLRKVCAY